MELSVLDGDTPDTMGHGSSLKPGMLLSSLPTTQSRTAYFALFWLYQPRQLRKSALRYYYAATWFSVQAPPLRFIAREYTCAQQLLSHWLFQYKNGLYLPSICISVKNLCLHLFINIVATLVVHTPIGSCNSR